MLSSRFGSSSSVLRKSSKNKFADIDTKIDNDYLGKIIDLKMSDI